MNPSRELDKLVAEKVFGYEVVQHNQVGRPDWHYKLDGALVLLPQYSKHIASAWLVVEKLRSTSLAMGLAVGTNYDNKWFVADYGGAKLSAGDTAPHAICLAALKAVGDTRKSTENPY